ncbi:aminomethyl-transferring glycine dehydrogenase [Neoroseomonas oryzicola]|uniref:Glycine dehydrogenase (decarboxylating) n=1 Tax=Neoroseomonas oryzicola TaxID=535904 RepID=A0A9X9WL34_9PROT|nr:aminomethyl-transferring glycine dehydrogenase [Neoroseomonas oryzicola]MBR0661044.1 aminomethyl-transferring glycine dehydrogenase [Neoroseomonas oryzicola]NKE18307.1 aminomethyl-transferring glycine dehydrogenase [Neoroseomonas oryzicola]
MSALDTLAALEAGDAFAPRHIGPSESEIAEMLRVVGASSLDDLAAKTVPAAILGMDLAGLPEPATELELLAELRAMALRNRADIKSLIGMGYHGTHTPLVIRRNVLENPGWYTAYTPYQAEIAQGRLEALVNFQTMICDLTGLPVANASLLDEGTAAAEAMHLAHAATRGKSDLLIAADDLHPQSKAVLTTRAAPLGIEVRFVKVADIVAAVTEAKPFALVLQYPGTTGEVRDLTAEIAAVQAGGGLAIVAADPLSLCLLTPPGEMGADVVVGSAQRFGVPMGYGGPHAAYMAVKDAHKRLMPGRLVGVSVDAAGAPAMRLALQTREQHIRREKATSNICTAQVLLAVMAGFYAVWHGPQGLKRIATRVNLLARLVAGAAKAAGFAPKHDAFFDTVALDAGAKAQSLMDSALKRGFNLARIDATTVGIALDETVTREELDALVQAIADAAGQPAAAGATAGGIPAALERRSAYCTAGVFNAHHSEHAMLRYLKALEDKDVALNRSMIPLGSCTMKLNATAEMVPVTLPGFSVIHPFAPVDQAKGYRELTDRLSDWLCRITGFAAVSLQPNAGSQGEYAGLLAIRAWHLSRGDTHRDICLIPASAHGTNPASAAMAGMKVVVVGTDRDGSVDLDDLKAKAEQHAANLAALMITYPSTHGVFETAIREICTLIHEKGGKVYMDGANMNAQVGLTSPASIGADVCHLNLHKTFCIPHGGGGPGVGPIGVTAELAPFLPGHPVVDCGGSKDIVVSAAPWGSASILTISYAYIRMMGAAELKRATQVAILAANYVAKRLEAHFPVLYRGMNNMVAHECILDCRGFQQGGGVMVEDIAKRLQDYGFHAPTMSWPVAGTLMVEPTESEPKAELDRFIDAMVAIRAEIRAIEQGRMDKADNPLKNAPHTAAEIAAETWSHPYSREQAAFPLPFVKARKYWPPVKRVDNVYGDRNLVCSCAPLEAYAQAHQIAAE